MCSNDSYRMFSTDITSGAAAIACNNNATLIKRGDLRQSTGNSTNDGMSQNAITSMVFADPSTKNQVKIGNYASIGSSATSGVAIGSSATANGSRGTALGYASEASGAYSVALAGSQASSNGELAVGMKTGFTNVGYNNSAYRLISGVYDGQSAHDAVTVGQINATIDAINAALNTTIPHIGAGA